MLPARLQRSPTPIIYAEFLGALIRNPTLRR